jgi:PAS domain S-box-containing protein
VPRTLPPGSTVPHGRLPHLDPSEVDYRAVLQQFGQGFCIIEVIFRHTPGEPGPGEAIDYRFLETNAAFVRETGLVNADGRTIRELVPDHDQLWFRVYGEVARTGRPASFESYAAAMGRWFRVQAFRVEPPELNRVALIFTDISAEIRARREEEKAEARLREIIMEAPAFMAVISGPDLIFEMANTAYLTLVGGRDVVGKSLTEAIPEIATTDFPATLRRVMQTGEPFHGRGTRILLANADPRGAGPLEPRYLDFVYQPLRSRDGRISGVLVHGVDLTDRFRTESTLARTNDALDRAAASLSLAQRAASAGVWDWDISAGAEPYVSAEYRDLYGFDHDQPMSYERWLQAVHPDDRARVEAYGADFFASGSDFNIEFRIIHPTRGVRWLAGVGTLLRAPDGTPARFSGINLDITDRKLAEEERAHLVDKLARSNAELERFASIASHDLREPLRGIATITEFVIEDDDGLSPESRVRLGRIKALCTRLDGMVRGLLEYARLSGTRQSVRCELAAIAAQAIDKLAEGLAGHVEITLHPDLPVIDGDPLLLERVFGNLIANAVKYNTSEIKRIEIGYQDGAVFVRDNGIGVDPTHHADIFGIFRRVRTHRDHADGIGLGLSLAKNIVELHGGTIAVTSEPGRGATFLLRFPDIQGVSSGDMRQIVLGQ